MADVDDNVDLRLITEDEIRKLEELADKAEQVALKTEQEKTKAKKNLKEISEDSKKLISGPATDISKFSNKKILPIEAASGENIFGYDLSKTPIMGGKTTNYPSDLLEKLEKIAEEKAQQKMDDFERIHGEILTTGNLKKFKDEKFFEDETAKEALQKSQQLEEKLDKFENTYAQSLSALKNPFGFATGKLTGALGKVGMAGLVALFGEEVVTDMFDLVKGWFETPGGIFDIRKRIKDAVYTIGDLQEQERIQNGSVFFIPDTKLYQHSPYHSNTENYTQYQQRFLYTSRFD